LNNSVTSCTKAWFADEEVCYSFPENWQVKVFSHKAQRTITHKQIYKKIQNPIGGPPLSTYLKPGMKICIISDDISRPTRSDILLPILLKILEESGIAVQDIRIVIASVRICK